MAAILTIGNPITMAIQIMAMVGITAVTGVIMGVTEADITVKSDSILASVRLT
jgi:hypothetical protein